MNNLKAVVDRLVRETGLSRTVSRRIAQKINRMAGKVNWATPVQGARVAPPGAGTAASPKAPAAVKPAPGSRIVLPKIPASKPVAKSSAGAPRRRSR